MAKRNKRHYYIQEQIENSLSIENGIACTSVQSILFSHILYNTLFKYAKNVFLIFYSECERSVWRLGDS
jgi:hypothetical protein